MRFGYLLFSLQSSLVLASRGRESRYTPSPPLISEEDAEDTMKSLDMTPRERQAVFGDTTIIKRLKVTDCHASIAKQLEGRCKSDKDQMEPNEAYRSDLAISLTICSLVSAMQTIPSDCEPWYRSSSGRDRDTPNWRIWWNVPDTKSASARSSCLGALHRSPQDWTSYNQYLSDATLLCSALRADWQMTRARELYANATMEKISLISLLRTNEDGRRKDQARLARDMSESAETTRRNAEATSDTLEMMQAEIQRQETLRMVLDTQIKQAMERLTAAGQGVWDGIRSQGVDATMTVVQDIRESHVDMVMALSNQLRASLSSLATEHGNTINLHHQRLGSDTDIMVAKLADTFDLLASDTKSRLDAFNHKLAETSSEAAVLQGNVVAATKLMYDLNPVLQASVQSAFAIQDHHNQTLMSLVKSRIAAMELSEELERSLGVITRTIALAQQHNSRSRWAVFSPSLFSVSAFGVPQSVFIQNGLLDFAANGLLWLAEAALWLVGWAISLSLCLLSRLLPMSLYILALADLLARSFDGCMLNSASPPMISKKRKRSMSVGSDSLVSSLIYRRPSTSSSTARMFGSRGLPIRQEPIVEEADQEEQHHGAVIPVFGSFASHSRHGRRFGVNNRVSGRSIVPSQRGRCVSVPL